MKAEKGLGSVKRFGVRYGKTVKDRLARIEQEQKKLQLCPYCEQLKAKRKFAGVYECSRCNAKFTGRAFFLIKAAEKGAEAEKEAQKVEETPEEPEEKEEESDE